MCSPEESALLRLEEGFSAALAHINSLVLQPLLSAGESRQSRQSRGCGNGALRAPDFSALNGSGHTWHQHLLIELGPGPQAGCSLRQGTLRARAMNLLVAQSWLCVAQA